MAGYLLCVAVTAAIVSWTVTYWVRREALRWGLVDRPGGRKRHRAPTPTAGGLAIWLALVGSVAVGPTLLWAVAGGAAASDAAPGSGLAGSVEGRAVRVLLVAATAMAVLGLVDDVRGLSWRVRLVVQALVAGLAVWWWVRLLPHPFAPSWLAAVLSTVWLVVLVNAFNMLDNMDGLSAGVAAIAAALLAGMALTASGDGPEAVAPGSAVLLFQLALLGSLLGFLWHNRRPARVFMGDCGSYLVGFSVGAAALLAARGAGVSTDRPVWIPVAALLCVFAVPLYDMASVVLIRLGQRRSPFLPDRNHLSHRLVESGLSEERAVLVIYLATAACGLPALLLLRLDSAVAPSVLSGVGGLFATLAVVDTFRWRRTRATEVDAQSGPDPPDGSTAG